jgi:hypothetical protein
MHLFDQNIHDTNTMSSVKKGAGDVAPNEARAAGYKDRFAQWYCSSNECRVPHPPHRVTNGCADSRSKSMRVNWFSAYGGSGTRGIWSYGACYILKLVCAAFSVMMIAKESS